jgi:hypothetical protein
MLRIVQFRESPGMTKPRFQWLLPWASALVVSISVDFALDEVLTGGSTVVSTPAEPQVVVSRSDQSNEERESCLSAWSRVSADMPHVHPDLERFAANYCVGSAYMPVPSASQTYERVRALDDPYGEMP